MKKVLFISLVILFTLPILSYGFSVETHMIINRTIAQKNLNGFSLNFYSRDILGMAKGINTKINGDNSTKIWALLSDGGVKEDNPYWLVTRLPVRAMYHFHDPFNEQGWAGWESAVFWAQKGIGRQWYGGYYSWFDVRHYYYDALTEEDNTERDANFAETFRGLGQLMHLVQDMSVPEHVRNDFHNPSEYEEWVAGWHVNELGDTVQNFNISKYTPHCFNWGLLITPSNFSYAPVPIANLYDTNQYEGSNPNPYSTLQEGIGLSEYTNANFLSPATIFSGYPYPSRTTSVEVFYDNITDPRDSTRRVIRQYYQKIADGDTGYRLANKSLLCDYALNPVPPEGWAYNLPVFDDNVYRDYADKLLPYAIGYSADLLHYFFRGTLEISLPSRFVYAIIDGSQPYKVFHYIKAKIKNTTNTGSAIEESGGGTLVAIAKYRLRTDTDPYNPDLSNDPPDAASRGDDFSYSVSAAKAINSLPSSGDGEEFEFDFSLAPIPAGITDLYLQVVFQGTLGNEEGTAVAVGLKDLTEPVHISLMNSSDRYYLNQQLKTAPEMEEILDDNSTLRSGLACNRNEEDEYVCDHPIYPFDVEFRVAFYTPDSPEPDLEDDTRCSIILNRLMPANYARVIVLGDMNETILIKSRHAPLENYMGRNADIDEGPVYTPVKMVTYQEDDAGEFITLPATHEDMALLRGTRQHVLSAFSIYSPITNGIWQAPWPPLANEEPVPINAINK